MTQTIEQRRASFALLLTELQGVEYEIGAGDANPVWPANNPRNLVLRHEYRRRLIAAYDDSLAREKEGWA